MNEDSTRARMERAVAFHERMMQNLAPEEAAAYRKGLEADREQTKLRRINLPAD